MLEPTILTATLPARYVRRDISPETRSLLENVLTPHDEAEPGAACALAMGVGLGDRMTIDPICDVVLKGHEDDPTRIMSLEPARRDRLALAAMAVQSDDAISRAFRFAREMREMDSPSHTRWGEAFIFPEGMVIALDMLTNQINLSEEDLISPPWLAQRVQMLVFPHLSSHARLAAQARMSGICAAFQPHLGQQLTNVGGLRIQPPNLAEITEA